ncbi:MAG: efflux RND transporter permease subunit, partial [Rhodanobacter sp.]
ASAETVAATVAVPIEQEINGVDNMLYQSSQSTADGKMTITVTFKVGTDLDVAQTLVQNRVAIAQPKLPEEVQRLGVTTRKTSPGILMAIVLVSPDGSLNQRFISNYALTQIRDRLNRIDGVGDTIIFGSREIAMRIWIDPDRAAARDLTAGEIVAALRAQNVQVAAGALGQPPSDNGQAFQLNLRTQGRLTTPEQFADIVIRTDAKGRQVRVGDVARVELGADDYGTNAYLAGKPAVTISVRQRPGTNALAAGVALEHEMQEAAKSFPPGLEYRIVLNLTKFIAQSTDAVRDALLEAAFLVVLVIFLFLQKWRAALIPVVAIPVSLIGTFALLAAFGYSLNSLSLFGLVLAIGIVVDDAIVVVENVERNLKLGFSPLEATRKSMDEVSGALVAIMLVLCAVFVPTFFLTGLSGAFYKQFALTISGATIISLILSLTLSPALAALLLKPHDEHEEPGEQSGIRRTLRRAGDAFNRGFDRFSAAYGRLTAWLVVRPKRVMVTYVCLILATIGLFWVTPTGFIPQQDQNYLLALTLLPPGASLARTDAVAQQVSKRIMSVDGVEVTAVLPGYDASSGTTAPNVATIFIPLKPFAKRDRRADAILVDIKKVVAGIDQARVIAFPPPVINGIGAAGGYRMMVQDRGSHGYKKLEAHTNQLIAKAKVTPGLTQVFTLFNTATPRLFTDIDRGKAELLGVPPERIFEALQVYLGSAYVNDFNLLGRTFHVIAQADQAHRTNEADVANLKVRSNSGAMVPIGSVATFKDETGPYRVERYNLFPAIAVDGSTAADSSSGESLKSMDALADQTLPAGYDHEWTGIAYQQKTAGNTAGLVFLLGVIFVFLVLAAQYESLTLPLAIILIVPMCLFAAMIGVNLRGMDNNVLTQIGLVVLIALAAKNAILVVEFAKQAEQQDGLSPTAAAVRAAQTRLRPILMTSLAFILGSVPMLLATGAGAELRQALGTAVFFGMLGVTGFGLIYTPTFYVVCRALGERWSRRRRNALDAAALQLTE